MNEKIFKKNIQTLNSHFQNIFKKIKKPSYKIIQTSDPLNINIQDKYGVLIYQNPLLELETMLAKYNKLYKLYPVLYFYGFGNGIIYKALLQNPNLQHIVVFEKDFEIIYIIFHYIDFSNELKNRRLILAQNNISNSSILALLSQNPFKNFIQTYFLQPHNFYYENFKQEILELDQKFLSCIQSIITIKGTDVNDTLQGIEQFVKNTPKMISKPCLKEFLNKRKKMAKDVLIVSTGPSLSKQLNLLKEYQNNTIIFCADSAYPILYENNIKPDCVFSVERIDYASEFFNNDFGDFDKDILFIIASLTHPKTIEYLEQNSRNYILISKETFEVYYGLHAFGYVDLAISVAHLAFIIAELLEFENIIFIGQDLAYNSLGESHPKNYLYTATSDSNLEKILLPSYGNKGYISSNTTWNIFKTNLEYLIKKSKSTIYNATEGGARIEGTIEKPFKEICESFFRKKINKNFLPLENFNPNKQKEYLLKTYYKNIELLKTTNIY
ncbi:TPA: motility associated factor glycosyltransferase family protein, partial [Campylobacter lari]|nr:motility associated factor glycosyltransferase family protein [Campylobacter lari]